MKIRFSWLIIVAFGLASVWAIEPDFSRNIAAGVLTQALAERILDAEVDPASGNTQPDGHAARVRISHCSYQTKASEKKSGHIDLVVRQSETAEGARVQFDSAKVIYRGKEVSGLGEAAFRPATLSQVHVLKGRSYIIVTAGASSKADPKLEENAASEILRRLRD
jgi:hypothetical protein